MQYLAFLLLAAVAFLLDAGVASELAIGPVVPRFLSVVLVGVFLTWDGVPAVLGAAGIGLLADCLTTGPLGPAMFAATAAAMAINWFRLRPPRNAVAMRLVFGFIILVWVIVAGAIMRQGWPPALTPLPLGVATALYSWGFLLATVLTKHLLGRLLWRLPGYRRRSGQDFGYVSKF